MYELMLETGWHEAPIDRDAWFSQYATSRYGRNTPSTQVWGS